MFLVHELCLFVCFILFNHGIKCPRSAKKAVFQRGREYFDKIVIQNHVKTEEKNISNIFLSLTSDELICQIIWNHRSIPQMICL